MNRLDSFPTLFPRRKKNFCVVKSEIKCLMTTGNSFTFINVEKKSFWRNVGKKKKKLRGHPDLNRGPLDLQSNALPLSYTPTLRD